MRAEGPRVWGWVDGAGDLEAEPCHERVEAGSSVVGGWVVPNALAGVEEGLSLPLGGSHGQKGGGLGRRDDRGSLVDE